MMTGCFGCFARGPVRTFSDAVQRVKKGFPVDSWSYKLMYIKHGIMTNTTELYSFIPGLMALTFTQGDGTIIRL